MTIPLVRPALVAVALTIVLVPPSDADEPVPTGGKRTGLFGSDLDASGSGGVPVAARNGQGNVDVRAVTVSDARRDEPGVLVHTVRSPYQAGETEIRVLLPDEVEEGRRYPVVYVLPVEARNEHRYGDGLLEALRHDLHNRERAIFVAPSFSDLPWYADHSSDPEIRQEAYFLEVVVPYVEAHYPAGPGRDGRLLLGFSKSGWGAWSLLLRHPDRFGRAAAWDAPLMMDRPGRYGSGEIFGTQANFERYRVATLLRRRADELRDRRRLILLGHGNFRDDHEAAHGLLVDLEVPHAYRDGPQREHRWESGWLPEAARLLLSDDERRGEEKR